MSHSTSSGRPGAAARTAAIAAATPPAAATWLSLISAASPSPIRWFGPPPQRTAYFSSWRSPGVVLRVSRTAHPVPASASAHARVAVAMPDRWVRKLSRVRSAPSSSRSGAADPQHLVAPADPVPVRAPRLRRLWRQAGRVEHGQGDREARQHARLPGHDAGHRRAPGAAVAAEVTSGP